MKHVPSVIFVIAIVVCDVVFVRALLGGGIGGVEAGAIGFVLALFTAMVVWAIVHVTGARIKGQVRLEFVDQVVQPGDDIEGVVHLDLRRRLAVERLAVTLRATVTSGSEDRTTTVVYEAPQDLLSAATLDPGSSAYPFVATVPTSIGSAAQVDLGELLPPAVARFAEQMLAPSLSSAPTWQLRVDVVVDGFDLTASEEVRVASVSR